MRERERERERDREREGGREGGREREGVREEERYILSLLNFDQKLTDQVPRHILSIPFVQMHCKDTPPNNRNK